MLVQHRLPPTLPIAHRLPPTLPIAQELQAQSELIAKRSSARAAASDECRRVAKELAKRRPPLLPHRQPPSLPPRPTIRAARRPSSAPLLLGQMSAAGGRSAWGYFKCTRSLHPETGDVLLRMQPPEDEQQGWPSIAIARPCTRDVLQHGPFAFKLSPSSEVCAHLIVTRLRKALAGKHVLEVGAGLGYAGIACAAWTDAASVTLTDGDPISVAALRRNVELNVEASAFGSTAVEARQLCYGGALYKEGDYRNARVFDCILCADCAYDRAFHLPLCTSLKRSLGPQGRGIVVASRRCGSLDDFTRCLQAHFVVEAWAPDAATDERFRGQKCFPSVYVLRHLPSA